MNFNALNNAIKSTLPPDEFQNSLRTAIDAEWMDKILTARQILVPVFDDIVNRNFYIRPEHYENAVWAAEILKEFEETQCNKRAFTLNNFAFDSSRVKRNDSGRIYVDTAILIQLIELHKTLTQVIENVSENPEDNFLVPTESDVSLMYLFSDDALYPFDCRSGRKKNGEFRSRRFSNKREKMFKTPFSNVALKKSFSETNITRNHDKEVFANDSYIILSASNYAGEENILKRTKSEESLDQELAISHQKAVKMIVQIMKDLQKIAEVLNIEQQSVSVGRAFPTVTSNELRKSSTKGTKRTPLNSSTKRISDDSTEERVPPTIKVTSSSRSSRSKRGSKRSSIYEDAVESMQELPKSTKSLLRPGTKSERRSLRNTPNPSPKTSKTSKSSKVSDKSNRKIKGSETSLMSKISSAFECIAKKSNRCGFKCPPACLNSNKDYENDDTSKLVVCIRGTGKDEDLKIIIRKCSKCGRTLSVQNLKENEQVSNIINEKDTESCEDLQQLNIIFDSDKPSKSLVEINDTSSIKHDLISERALSLRECAEFCSCTKLKSNTSTNLLLRTRDGEDMIVSIKVQPRIPTKKTDTSHHQDVYYSRSGLISSLEFDVNYVDTTQKTKHHKSHINDDFVKVGRPAKRKVAAFNSSNRKHHHEYPTYFNNNDMNNKQNSFRRHKGRTKHDCAYNIPSGNTKFNATHWIVNPASVYYFEIEYGKNIQPYKKKNSDILCTSGITKETLQYKLDYYINLTQDESHLLCNYQEFEIRFFEIQKYNKNYKDSSTNSSVGSNNLSDMSSLSNCASALTTNKVNRFEKRVNTLSKNPKTCTTSAQTNLVYVDSCLKKTSYANKSKGASPHRPSVYSISHKSLPRDDHGSFYSRAYAKYMNKDNKMSKTPPITKGPPPNKREDHDLNGCNTVKSVTSVLQNTLLLKFEAELYQKMLDRKNEKLQEILNLHSDLFEPHICSNSDDIFDKCFGSHVSNASMEPWPALHKNANVRFHKMRRKKPQYCTSLSKSDLNLSCHTKLDNREMSFIEDELNTSETKTRKTLLDDSVKKTPDDASSKDILNYFANKLINPEMGEDAPKKCTNKLRDYVKKTPDNASSKDILNYFASKLVNPELVEEAPKKCTNKPRDFVGLKNSCEVPKKSVVNADNRQKARIANRKMSSIISQPNVEAGMDVVEPFEVKFNIQVKKVNDEKTLIVNSSPFPNQKLTRTIQTETASSNSQASQTSALESGNSKSCQCSCVNVTGDGPYKNILNNIYEMATDIGYSFEDTSDVYDNCVLFFDDIVPPTSDYIPSDPENTFDNINDSASITLLRIKHMLASQYLNNPKQVQQFPDSLPELNADEYLIYQCSCEQPTFFQRLFKRPKPCQKHKTVSTSFKDKCVCSSTSKQSSFTPDVCKCASNKHIREIGCPRTRSNTPFCDLSTSPLPRNTKRVLSLNSFCNVCPPWAPCTCSGNTKICKVSRIDICRCSSNDVSVGIQVCPETEEHDAYTPKGVGFDATSQITRKFSNVSIQTLTTCHCERCEKDGPIEKCDCPSMVTCNKEEEIAVNCDCSRSKASIPEKNLKKSTVTIKDLPTVVPHKKFKKKDGKRSIKKKKKITKYSRFEDDSDGDDAYYSTAESVHFIKLLQGSAFRQTDVNVWALTKVNMFSDGSRSIEVIDVTPIPSDLLLPE